MSASPSQLYLKRDRQNKWTATGVVDKVARLIRNDTVLRNQAGEWLHISGWTKGSGNNWRRLTTRYRLISILKIERNTTDRDTRHLRWERTREMTQKERQMKIMSAVKALIMNYNYYCPWNNSKLQRNFAFSRNINDENRLISVVLAAYFKSRNREIVTSTRRK